jgi:hypothetical protein
MSHQAKKAYQDWQDAEARARQAEEKLRIAWEAFDGKQGHAPSPDLIAEVSHCRAVANEKLTSAMVQIGAAAGHAR